MSQVRRPYSEYLDMLEDMLEEMGVSREIIDFAELWNGKEESTLIRTLFITTDYRDFDQLDCWRDEDFYFVLQHTNDLWLLYRNKQQYVLNKDILLKDAGDRERYIVENATGWEPFEATDSEVITISTDDNWSACWDVKRKYWCN